MNRLKTPRSELEHIGEQTLFVDPRDQGFGLSEHPFLDGYANKFFSLTEPGGSFISPRPISDWLREYYEQVGFAVADQEDIATLPTASRIEDIRADSHTHAQLASRRGELIVPYMTTGSVETIAEFYGLQTLGAAATISAMADKAVFQQKLSELAPDIARETGFDVTIPSVAFAAGDREQTVAAYRKLSHEGTADVVAIKPKSASALGIFVVRAHAGLAGLQSVLDSRFEPDEELLLESFVSHNHSPSMQGVVDRDGHYQHLYFGRQLVAIGDDGSVGYDGNQTPFNFASVQVGNYDTDRMQAVHQIVGNALVAEQGIQGIAGLDSITNIAPDGTVLDFKLTELNLHLPGSIAVYAAIQKLFPSGFSGTAYNTTVPLQAGQTSQDFFRIHRDKMIKQPQTYGLFPINASYDDKIDIIAFGEDAAHAEALLRGVQQ